MNTETVSVPFTATCPDCQKVFSKSSQTHADAALRMHRDRVHTLHIKTPTKASHPDYWQHRTEHLRAVRAGRRRIGRPSNADAARENLTPAEKLARIKAQKAAYNKEYRRIHKAKLRRRARSNYLKKTGKLEVETAIPQHREKVARLELNTIGQQLTMHYCPNCGFHIGKVALAMAVAEQLKD